ncbi:hypothetical protein HED60_09965 [Planctomycetales bacterium ZRK34]|nr:hypothetical protein HED60_09965 [Planctomycetales bacterium ZRK34]
MVNSDTTSADQILPPEDTAAELDKPKKKRRDKKPVQVAPRRVSVPPEPYDRWRLWSSLIISVVVCLPPLLVDLGAADVGSNRESITLLAARETWQASFDGKENAWLIPTVNSENQLTRPPMSVWLTMASWWDLDPQTVTTDTLIWRARMMSVLLAVLTLIGTYWAGMSIGGVRVARLATMALGTTLLFAYQMRYAAPDSHLLAFVTLSIASGLWAMRPLKPINWVGRRVSGWLLAGLALGAAIMTTGWSAPIFVLPPLVAAICLTPMRRVGNTIGLIFAIILGLIASAPWYLYVSDQVPEATRQLFGQVGKPEALFLLTWSHGRVLMMLSPWQIWLMGALCQPFIRAEHERRRQLLIAWFWFILIFIAFSIPAARHPRYLVPLLPAAGLMVGQLWSYHAHLATQRQVDPGVNLLRVPHWILMAIASIAGPLFVAFQPELLEAGYIDHIELPGATLPLCGGLGLALLLIVLLGARWHYKWRPRLAMYATVAWMLIATTLGMAAYSRSHHNQNLHREHAEHLTAMAGDHLVVYLQHNAQDAPPDEAFLFYAGRVIRPASLEQIDALVAESVRIFVIVPNTAEAGKLMMEHGLDHEFDLTDPARRVYSSVER